MTTALAPNPVVEGSDLPATNGHLQEFEAQTIALFVQLSRVLGHPCKIYNILAVAAPVLYIGPAVSHISEITSSANGELSCFSSRHEDVDAVVNHLQRARAEARERSPTPSSFLRNHFSAEVILPKLTAQLESA
jgi:hypothetical protein